MQGYEIAQQNISSELPNQSVASLRSEKRKLVVDKMRMATLAADFVCILASVATVHCLLRYFLFPDYSSISETWESLIGKYIKQMAFFSIITIYLLRMNRLYEFEAIRHPKMTFPLMLKVAFAVLGLEIFYIVFMPHSLSYYSSVVLVNLTLLFPMIYLCRVGISWIFRISEVADLSKIRVIIMGAAEDADKFINHLNIMALIEKDFEHEVVGWIPLMEPGDQDVHVSISHANQMTVSKSGGLSTILRNLEVDAVVILPSAGLQDNAISTIVEACENEFVQLKVVSRFFPVLTSALKPTMMGGLAVMGVDQLPLDRFVNRLLKRSIDILGAIVGLLLAAPIIAFFAFLVRLESPGPVLYTQVRNGLRNRHFKILKIRSMRLDSELNGAVWAQKDDPRRLRIGALMRQWNIDELPQFWNVLIGEMSLVGPRPERPELVKKFQNIIPHYGHRQTHQPGMTGWAQVNGWRGDTSLEERIRFDIWYIENWSVWLDLVIMLKTFLRNKNAY